MDNEEQQKKSFKWFLDNIQELVKRYPEKYIAIKDCKVLGAYNSFMEALTKTEKSGYKQGTFIVQQASADPSAYTVTLYNSYLGVI